ncbi:MAG: NPCBM/NEW2 domain-containing protein, partial [Planctomycetota bacterium]
MERSMFFGRLLVRIGLVVAVGLVTVAAGAAAGASTEEFRQAHQWAEVAFARPRVAAEPDDSLTVVRRKHYVLTNRSGWNTPLTLGDRQYAHGMYMDAPAAVRVRLSRPAVEFTAQVGIDNNQSTRGKPDAGSARFHVAVEGERVFSTPVCKLATGATDVKVALKGAKEFFLEVDDGGNGVGWDQCDWADAAVKLDDGKTLFLDELPVRAGPSTRRLGVPFSFTYDGKPSDGFLDA